MKFVAALTLALAFVGCSKEKEDPKVDPPSSLFEAGDLDAGNVKSVSSSEIGGAVNEQASNYAANSSDSSNLTDADDEASQKCLDAKFDALLISADKANASVDQTIDLKDCSLAGASGDGITYEYTTAEAKIRFWFGCKNDDIQDLDGTPAKDIGDQKPELSYCKSEEEVQTMFGLDLHLAVKATIDTGGDPTVLEMETRSLSAMQTADGAPCSAAYADGNWTWDNACVSYSSSKTVKMTTNGVAAEDQGVNDYVKLAYGDLVESHDPHTWYESGHFDVTLNNWTGTVNFDGGSNAPTWQMTDGSTTKTGAVGAFALQGKSLAQTVGARFHQTNVQLKLKK